MDFNTPVISLSPGYDHIQDMAFRWTQRNLDIHIPVFLSWFLITASYSCRCLWCSFSQHMLWQFLKDDKNEKWECGLALLNANITSQSSLSTSFCPHLWLISDYHSHHVKWGSNMQPQLVGSFCHHWVYILLQFILIVGTFVLLLCHVAEAEVTQEVSNLSGIQMLQ